MITREQMLTILSSLEPTVAYIVDRKNKVCIEKEAEEAPAYANAFQLEHYPHFPYEELGYDNPYAFLREWDVYDRHMNLIKIEWREGNNV